MPLPGDQHRDNAATTNPFVEQKPHVAEYTAQEIATLQSRLDKQLGPEYISTRPGAGGGKVHYLAAEKVINLANEVFGFNGWSSAIQNVQVDFVDENRESGKITLGLSTIVRVTLRDGTYHEDIGYGHIENCKGKAAAFEKAKKEAATDAMKRALRNFGNVLGNCLYDKDYLQKVTKVKIAPTKWDADELHRHRDYAPIKREAIAGPEQPQGEQKSATARRQASNQSGVSYGSMEFEDDFGGNPFDEADAMHPDEVRIDDSTVSVKRTKQAVPTPPNVGQQRQGVPRMQSMPQMRPPDLNPPQPVQNLQAPQRPQGPQRPPHEVVTSGRGLGGGGAFPPQHYPDAPATKSNSSSTTAKLSNHLQQHRQLDGSAHDRTNHEQPNEPELPLPRQPPPGIPEGFVTGRSVEMLNQPPEARPSNAALAFNPHAETPSIRRTHGINPGKSAPVMRSAIGGAAPANAPAPAPGAMPVQIPQPPPQHHIHSNGLNGVSAPVRTNFVNPSADVNRRIGMPASAASHAMQNRGTAYRAVTPTKRPPLSDVSNIQQTDGAGDEKRVKLDQPESEVDEVTVDMQAQADA